MFAVISDIHSNIEALRAVLSDIDARGIESIYCLGDVVGYGPQPGACVDLIKKRCVDVIMGNHDYAVLYEPTRFNIGAENAVFWTRQKLEEDAASATVARRWEFLGGLDVRSTLGGEGYGAKEFVLAHGSPRRPINEYLFPDDIYNNTIKLGAAFERMEHICFVGHTHVPGVFTETMEFWPPEDLDEQYEFEEQKAIVNVGSVGQPRDRDPRACYVVVHPGKVEYVRVEYSVEKTVTEVLSADGLDDYLGTRLRDGR